MSVLGQVHFTLASLVAIVQAAIGLAIAFGAGLSVAEQHAIVQVVTALGAALPIGGAIIGHAQINAGAAAASPSSTAGAAA